MGYSMRRAFDLKETLGRNPFSTPNAIKEEDTKEGMASVAFNAANTSLGYNNIALFSDSRVSYDLLRFPTMFVLQQSVREMISPYTLFARNHISNHEECTVRMNKLHLIPWLSLYINPANSIVQNESYPVLPLDVEWRLEQHDQTILDYNPMQRRGFRMTTVSSDDSKIPSVMIKPISASSVQIPENNFAILNFSNMQEQVDTEREKSLDISDFCMRDVKLSLVASNPSDFLLESSNIGETNSVAGDNNGEQPLAPNFQSGRPKARDDYLNFLRSSNY